MSAPLPPPASPPGQTPSAVDRLNRLFKVTSSLTSELSVQEILQQILHCAQELVAETDTACLYIYDPNTNTLRVRQAVGLGPVAYDMQVDLIESLSGRVLASGHGSIFPTRKSIIEATSAMDARVLQRHEAATGGVRYPASVVCSPLKFKARPIGTLILQNLTKEHAFSTFDVELLDALAQAAAVAVVNAELYESEHSARTHLEILTAEAGRHRDELQRQIRIQEALAQVIREGLTFQSLARRTAEVCGCSVWLLDSLNRVRANAPGVRVARLKEGGLDIDWEAVQRHLRTASRTRTPQRVQCPGARHLLVAPACIAGDTLGFAVALLDDPQADHVEATAIDFVALLTASELLKERTGLEAEARHQEQLLERLLTGHLRPHDAAAAELLIPSRICAALIYSDMGVVAPPNEPPVGSLAELLRTGSLGPASPIPARASGLVATLVPDQGSLRIDDLETQLQDVGRRLGDLDPGWQVTFAIGARVTSLADLEAAWEDARLAVESWVAMGRPPAVFSAGSVGAYRFILKSASGAEATTLIGRVLGPILRHDAGGEGRAPLLKTVREYFSCGESLKSTASVLNVHVHTVQYRLKQVGRLSGLDLSNAEDRITLHLATRLWGLVDGNYGASAKFNDSSMASEP